ncbi:MAG: hypothetical protein C5B55_14010 [Blastocatellia bacterium]|nr:MAG: hypothetical protein C5B55_14010 [Blastocatellia bacterium]
MSEERNWKRIRERLALNLPVRVQCRETPDFEWMEVTRLTNVTPFGAGFTLKRPTEKGRLLYMTIPMPRQLRVFDHVENQYRIWAVVRYVKRIDGPVSATNVFDVGVAFIGRRPPASHEREPWKRYDISNQQFQTAANPEDVVKPIPTSDERRHTRHNIPIDMLLEVLDEQGTISQTESTVTENISKKGATLFTTLKVAIGRFLRLTSQQYNLTVHAAVRGASTGMDGIPRLHVEFIDGEWPL